MADQRPSPDATPDQLRRAAKAPLVAFLATKYHEPSAHAVHCIDALADRLLDARRQARVDQLGELAHLVEGGVELTVDALRELRDEVAASTAPMPS